MTNQTPFAAALFLSLQITTAAAQNQQTNAPPTRPTPTPASAGRQQQQTLQQTPQQQQPQRQQPPPRPVAAPTTFDLSDYGVRIEPEPRLVVMMAALEAAGWDPTPKGGEPSVFRQTVRREQESLDAALRKRLRDFYEANRLPGDAATPADQAARYVSLAYTLGPAPAFEAPPRSDDLPPGVLDVLDFVPLLREFYQQSGMNERLPRYFGMHREEANRLRQPTTEMVRTVLTYLHTRPQLSIVEVVQPAGPAAKADPKKKSDQQRVRPVIREKERRFLIVPDLLAAPGAINFRVLRDDYYVIAPFDTDPNSSELRRAYLLYVIDPLVLRHGRDISAKRPAIKQLLDEQRARNPNVTPDVFLAVARSLVAAAESRIEESGRLRELQLRTSKLLKEARDDAARAEVAKESQGARARIEDEAVARLAEAYERGAVLSFYFAEQLRGLETSGFDLSNFLGDMISTIDPAREGRRLAEAAEAVKRHAEARARKGAEREAAAAAETPVSEGRAALIKSLGEVEQMLRLKNYTDAEARLRALQKQYPQEPRVYFGLAQATSLSAQDAFDESLQAQRLNTALGLYQDTIRAASPDTDAALISRAHAASGRILAHLERPTEAVKEFDEAIRIGDVAGGAYREAVSEKQKLSPRP